MSLQVAQLLANLREHGTIDSEGDFTVSLSAARRKLSRYQTSDPARYLLLAASGGIAAGATLVRITQGLSSYGLRFPSAYIRETALLGSFEKPSESAAGSLDMAMALRGVLVQAATSIVVEVVDPQRPSYRWSLTPRSDESTPIPAEDETMVRVVIEFPSSWQERLTGIFRRLRGYAGQPPEIRLLDKFCDHSPVPISVNGTALNRDLFLPVSVVYAAVGDPGPYCRVRVDLRLEARGWSGILGLRPGRVQLVVHGVAYGQIEDLGLTGVVFHGGLTRDVSRENLVCDSVYDELLEQLEDRRREMLIWSVTDLERIYVHGVDFGVVLEGLVELALSDELPQESLARTLTWLEEKVGPMEAQHEGGDRLRLLELACELSPQLRGRREEFLLTLCGSALERRSGGIQPLLRHTLGEVRQKWPSETLVPGYLLLGLGADLSSRGEEKQAQERWLEALDTVRAGDDDLAEQLIHAHMDFEVGHIMDEVVRALRLHLAAEKK